MGDWGLGIGDWGFGDWGLGTSMMENSYANTKYDFYIMIPSDFSIENQRKFLNLENIYKCSITFIDMKEQFKTAKIVRYLTTPAYYRLALPHLLPLLINFKS